MTNFSIIQKSQLEGATRLDAEYYQSEYLRSQNELGQITTHRLVDVASVSDGNHGEVSQSFSNEGIRYLRGKDLNNFFISDDDPIFIPESVYNKIARSHIRKGDVLVSIVGTVGMIGLVARDFEKLTGSCKIAILRPRSPSVDSWFLAALLMCRYGQHQIQRKVAGALQMGIILKDLSEVRVPSIDLAKQKKIRHTLENSFQETERSKSLHQQAENILLEALGLNDFDFDSKLFSIVNLSDVRLAERFDAEYFQEKYKILEERLKEREWQKLGDLASMKKGIEVGAEEYREEGKIFIRVSSLSKEGITESDQKYVSDRLYDELKNGLRPKKGEILLSKDATPGIAYLLKEDIEGIVSGGILRLTVKEGIDGEYLALCLNSLIGQMQAKRDAGGSVIAHWKPEQVKDVVVPILSREIQEQISGLVRQSHEARRRSKELLEEAKRKVEELIEKGGAENG